MKLSLEQLRAITCGAVSVEQEADGVHFYRFTQEQLALYKVRLPEFYSRSLSTAGVRFCFRTNSRKVALEATLTPHAGVRRFFSFAVFVNGERKENWNNYAGFDMTGNYKGTPLPVGDFSWETDLGEGEKEVSIQLPWGAWVALKGLYLDDGTTVIPVKRKKKLLCFGDSITQGYDALCPSYRYASRLSDYLNAEECNRAVGGEVFFPELAKTKESFVPDIITAAYGTNDYMHVPVEKFRQNCKGFYENLHENYPNVPTYIITPIWRKEQNTEQGYTDIHDIEKCIREMTAPFANMTVIRGYDLVPHDGSYFGDLILHPNNEGFEHYIKNLIQAMNL